MRFLWRWIKRGVLALIVLIVLLLLPVGYTELACQGDVAEETYQPLITDAAWKRPESRTLMTYPEWHIVHAYDDYAEVIRTGDPHDFGYLRSIADFWTTLCPLSQKSAEMGGVTTVSKMTIYTIGVSFTAELLAKAAYEETIGRIATMIRGETRAPLDDLRADQAADYAKFLHQTPWYKWGFDEARAQMAAQATDSFRDRERAFAVGLEFRAKASYARLLDAAVEATGDDVYRIRSIVAGVPRAELEQVENLTIVEERAEGTLIETDRFRLYTRLLNDFAQDGGQIVEIAGNDEILFTAISDQPTAEGALYSFARQGYGDYRHLIVVPVADLAERLRNLGELKLEHIHDY